MFTSGFFATRSEVIMSWNPFSKLSAQPKRSVITKTTEREFDKEVKKIEQLDESTKKLYKDMKKCSESFAALSKSEVKMAQGLSSHDTLRQAGEDWSHSASRLDLHMQEMISNNQKTVIEPMKKFSSIFPSVQNAVKKREQCLQEYNKCQVKVEKYQEKERTGPNIVKLETSKKATEAAREEFESQNATLMKELPKLNSSRKDYFSPCLRALVQSQVVYFTEAFKVYTELATRFNIEDDHMTDIDYLKQLNQKLNEIKSLSIVADD